MALGSSLDDLRLPIAPRAEWLLPIVHRRWQLLSRLLAPKQTGSLILIPVRRLIDWLISSVSPKSKQLDLPISHILQALKNQSNDLLPIDGHSFGSSSSFKRSSP